MTSGRTDSSDARRQRPTNDDPAAWRAYWQALGQPWRTEPEIDEERKEELAGRAAITSDPDRAEFPFQGVELSRRDVEWLLETHEDGRGPVNLLDPKQQYRQGLDLRDANLCRDLSRLPLDATHLRGANLKGAHLEGATLREAHLEGANLSTAHLEGANLQGVHLEGARLAAVHLEGALLPDAHLEGAVFGAAAHLEGTELLKADLEGAYLLETHLEGADLLFAYLKDANLSGAHLEGTDLREAHLEGAYLPEAHLEGKKMDPGDLGRLREWQEDFPEMLSPADLRGAYFDIGTDITNIFIGGTERVSPRLADVRWNGTNLAVVDWEGVDELGDERYAEGLDDYRAAVRANRQLAVTLRGQGMTEVADGFAYRAQVLQRKVYRLRRQTGRCLLSLFSSVIAGYGYRPARTLGWYVGVIFACALLYYLLGNEMGLADALIGSVTAFHGRGLFDTHLNNWQGAVASVEAFFGLVIEIAFIVTFTQRFFGK